MSTRLSRRLVMTVLAGLPWAGKNVLDRDELLDLAHGMQPDIFDRTIDLQISRLRRKIEDDPKNPIFIKTVRGKGYVWCTDVEHVA